MSNSSNTTSADLSHSSTSTLTIEQVTERHGVRPLTARSAVASVLLGVDPPRLPAAHLVEAGRLFGIAEGTTRVALSRMVVSGEVVADDGSYRLAGRLLERHRRQDQSRVPLLSTWEGDWVVAVVRSGRRAAQVRADLRRAAGSLRLSELREGVWMRPDNLDGNRLPEASNVVSTQCDVFTSAPEGDPRELCSRLWDLSAWTTAAIALQTDMEHATADLERGAGEALGPAFMLGAAVLRHLLDDPILPAEYLPSDWPGPDLRTLYDRYLGGYQALWREVFAR